MNKFYKIFGQSMLVSTLLIAQPVISAEPHSGMSESIKLADVISQQKFSLGSKEGTAIFTLTVNNQTLTFDLTANQGLFRDKTTMQKMSGGGEFELYKGKIVGVDNSWARFSNKNGVITGAYFDGKSLIFLRPQEAANQIMQSNALRSGESVSNTSNNIVAIDIENIEHNGTCGLHDHQGEQTFSYDHYVDSIKSSMMTDPNQNQQISINLFADTEFVDFYNGSANKEEAAEQEMLEHINIADGIFTEQLNIRIVANDSVAFTDNGDFTSSVPVDLLNTLVNSNLPNPGLRHLFTGKDLSGTTVGIAYVSTLCGDYSSGVTQRLNTLTPLILTHELGHNFGAPHDTQAGSACENAPSGFVMSPNITNTGPNFSSCSVDIMEDEIAFFSSFSNSCIIDEPVQVEIISEAGTVAELGIPYVYDNDNTLDLEGVGPFIYSVDIGPSGMSIDNNGTVSWTPVAEDIGTQFVQITVQNQSGQDTQSFDVEVTSDFINIKEQGLSSYGGSQDASGGAEYNNNPLRVLLEGNTWKQLLGNFVVTPDTIIEFEFSANVEGEIHGIGFDNDNLLSHDKIFSVHGTQSWGERRYRYTGNGNTQSFAIPVGKFYTGTFDRLVLLTDNDANIIGADSIFSNIRIYNRINIIQSEFTINFLEQTILPFAPFSQDFEGTSLPVENGTALELTGNKWQKVNIDQLISINPNTVVEFEFKSTSEAEIHGIGFPLGNQLNSDRVFKLYGTQSWGINDASYIGNGEYQTFIIPVGQYLTQNPLTMVFIMDDDNGDQTGNSTFRNVKIYDVE